MKRLHLPQGVAGNHRIRWENTPERVVAVNHTAELLQRELLRLGEGNREVAQHVGLEPRQLRLRELRVAGDVGDQGNHLRTELREHVGAHRGGVAADADGQRTAHARGLLRHLRGGPRGRAFAQEIAGEIGEPDLVGLLEGVPGAHAQGDAHFRHRPPLHERDLQAVVEREALGLGDLEVARHARLRRFGREGRNRRLRRGLLHRLSG
jgi:hypothetical protein